MSVSGYRGKRFEPRQQYVVSLSKTLYPHCFSRLSCEMITRWRPPREGCSVLCAFRRNSSSESRICCFCLLISIVRQKFQVVSTYSVSRDVDVDMHLGTLITMERKSNGKAINIYVCNTYTIYFISRQHNIMQVKYIKRHLL